MKANELMIGDWVHCAKLDYAPENYVANMQVKQLYVADLDTYSFKELKYEDIEPIPLTAEILRKSGFAQHHSYEEGITFEKFVTDGMRIDQLAKDLFVWICPGTDMGILTLHNVHELQHALHLCKIEKEIEL